MKRFATTAEQEIIEKANALLAEVNLVVTETQPKDGGKGAVIPTRGF